MKIFFILSALFVYSQAGIVPASTTLIKQSTAIAHPTAAFTYSQPIAIDYNAPIYSHYTPVVYSQHLLAPAHYTLAFYAHQLLGQQPNYAQYPGAVIVAQNPLAQYPVNQLPGQQQGPTQDNSPMIEPADKPQAPPQPPSPSGESSGATNFDDDTVSIEA